MAAASALTESGFGVTLICATAEALDAEDAGGEALAAILDVAPPLSWPPEFNDATTRAWMRRMLTEPGAEPGYGNWYIVAGGRLVGNGGYKGPPDAAGEVEIGYSIIPEEHRRGYASGAVNLLVQRAFRDPRVVGVIGETIPTLVGSQRVLERCGFSLVSRTQDAENGEILRYRRSRPD